MSDLVTLRDLRRGQIIAAARGLIAAGGFEALTISALEARLDFSRGVMTYHFRNKDEIVDSVLASVIEEIDLATSAGVKASLTLEEKVRAVLVSKVDGFLAHPEAARILFSFWGRLADPHIAATNADLYRRYRAQGVELLGDAAPEKVEALATLMVGVVLGIVAQVTFDPERVNVEAALEEACKAVLARLTD